MKNILALVCAAVIFLTGGTGITSPDMTSPAGVSPGIRQKNKPDIHPPGPRASADDASIAPMAYAPEKELTIKETVEVFFEQQYNGYLSLKYIDVSSIVNIEKQSNLNMLKWLKMMMMRRNLIAKNDLGYVDTERLPYEIVYDDVPNDNRMQMWRGWLANSGETVIHFHIKGTKGKVYPPFMAVNAQHSMLLKKIDGVWKIQMHYFPGSARKFTNISAIKIPTEEKMLAQLKKEFAQIKSPAIPEPSDGLREYDAGKAVRYANKYTEQVNADFRRLGDWEGDCANFVSQCIWAGFGGGDSMTSQWYSGSYAWINVNSFWSYISSDHGLKGRQVMGIKALKPGDVIQTRTASVKTEKERYTHMMMLVDSEKLIIAQNTPSAFVYYSDLANVDVRFVRPTYLAK